MNTREYWSEQTNPQTGKQFAQFLDYLKLSHDGTRDIDRLLDSDYGAVFTRGSDSALRRMPWAGTTWIIAAPSA